jgi:hypothetical protein
MLQRTLPAGFIAPCLPIKTTGLPSGGQWLHEIKHDGFRVIARKDGPRVRLYSRPGNDLTHRFPLIVDALARLRSRSCIIDGEAVACDDNGVASFDLVRHHRANDRIFLYAFDLIELNGDDLRRDPLEGRKATLRPKYRRHTQKKAPPKRGRFWAVLQFCKGRDDPASHQFLQIRELSSSSSRVRVLPPRALSYRRRGTRTCHHMAAIRSEFGVVG